MGVFSASSAFFSLTFFSFFFFPGFEMRVFFLFFYLSYMILESNSIHAKTVSGVRERDSSASSAGRNRRGIPWEIIGKAIGNLLPLGRGVKTSLEKKRPEGGENKFGEKEAGRWNETIGWLKEMYEKMDPHMEIETKRRIMMNRLDQNKCAKSKYSGLCIDGKVVGCSLYRNLYYYCWHTCGDSWCWTKRLAKDLRCNTWMDCGSDAFLNNEYEIPDVTDSESEHEPEV